MNASYGRAINGYYLKVPPSKTTYDKIKLKLNTNVLNSKGVTVTYWMKLWGVLKTSNEDCSLLLNISNVSNSFLCYESSTKIFYLIVNGAFKIFKDPDFYLNIGKWIFISISNYNAFSTYKYFPSMTNIFLFNNGLIKQDVKISNSGISIDTLELPTQVAALFADLRIYSTYILQPYGKIMSNKASITDTNMIQRFMLSNASDPTKCLYDLELSNSIQQPLHHLVFQHDCIDLYFLRYNNYRLSLIQCLLKSLRVLLFRLL